MFEFRLNLCKKLLKKNQNFVWLQASCRVFGPNVGLCGRVCDLQTGFVVLRPDVEKLYDKMSFKHELINLQSPT